MKERRVFLAIPLPAEIQDQLQKAQQQLRPALPGMRWTNPATLHLTLRFFGHLPEEFLEKIAAVMLSIGRFSAPFELQLRGLGAFPSPGRPRVVWIGTRDNRPLLELHARLDSALQAVGIPREERPFTPHLTLGRSREKLQGAGAVLERYRDFAGGTLQVDRLILFESRLHPSGAEHIPLRTVFLGQGEE